jgi:hypothetical protein
MIYEIALGILLGNVLTILLLLIVAFIVGVSNEL